MAAHLQVLHLVDRRWEDLTQGKKLETIRLDESRVKNGFLIYISHPSENKYSVVRVIKTMDIKLREVLKYTQDKTHRPNEEALLELMRLHYPNIELDTMIQFIVHLSPEETKSKYPEEVERLERKAKLLVTLSKKPLAMKLDLRQVEIFEPAKLSKEVRLRNFDDLNTDRSAWVNILLGCDEVKDQAEGERRFEELQNLGVVELRKRIFFIEDTTTKEIMGTISAWLGELDGVKMGRIHWLSVRREFRNKKYASALLTKALVQLSAEFNFVYLKTSTKNIEAVNLYRKYGFKPVIATPYDEISWNALDEIINL